ncbi:hypothetical protein V1519DRAFT_470090 [Lipomyces tetrasporus]
MQSSLYVSKVLAKILLAASVVGALFLTLQLSRRLPTSEIEEPAEHSADTTYGNKFISLENSYECINPYAQPGFIWMETRTTVDNTTWVPFYSVPVDKIVNDTRYFPNNFPPNDLLKNAPTQWFQLLHHYRNAADTVSTEKEPGRNWNLLLVIGDSVDETLVSHLCNSNASLEYGPTNDSNETSIVTCNIKEWNLTITHWQLGCVGNHCRARETIESIDQKWDRYFVPTSGSVVGQNGASPDLVIFQLGLWGEQFFVNQYRKYIHGKKIDYSRTLNVRELVVYVRLLRRIISKLRDMYGHHIPILYRTVALKNTKEQGVVALNLDRVARYAGYYSFYSDDVNIDKSPLRTLWVNMVLWYLFRTQGGVEVRGDLDLKI